MAKFRADECESENDENKNENEERDIFNNEALENPISSGASGMEPRLSEKNRLRDTISEEPIKNSNTSQKCLKNYITVEGPKVNESTFRSTIN